MTLPRLWHAPAALDAPQPMPPPVDAADVLRDLADALHDGTLLAWCVAHAPDGRDPLPAAWAACDDAAVRNRVLCALHGGPVWCWTTRRWALGHRAYWVAVECRAGELAHVLVDDGAEPFAAALRALYPTLTLAALLAARPEVPRGR